MTYKTVSKAKLLKEWGKHEIVGQKTRKNP